MGKRSFTVQEMDNGWTMNAYTAPDPEPFGGMSVPRPEPHKNEVFFDSCALIEAICRSLNVPFDILGDSDDA